MCTVIEAQHHSINRRMESIEDRLAFDAKSRNKA
jgi:hypothetical protein